MKRVLVCLISAFMATAGCAGTASRNAHVDDGQAKTGTQAGTAAPSEALSRRLAQIARTIDGRVGIAATIFETGESVAFNADQRFPMQSVYKFPIGMAVGSELDAGRLRQEQKVRVRQTDFVSPPQHSPIRDRYPRGTELTVGELLKYMVSESDGTACDVLLELLGGTQFVRQYLQGLGIDEIIVANTEKEIGADEAVQYQNWATPRGMVRLLGALHEGRGLSPSSRTLLLRLMTETPTGLRRLKGLLPAGTNVAHKTGSSGTVRGRTAATNDVGLLTLAPERHVAIAVFVSDTTADERTREAIIAQAARAVWDEWSR